MWRYPADKINTGWALGDLAERVRAADQLNNDVVLVWNDNEATKGLEVWYRKRPEIPFDFK